MFRDIFKQLLQNNNITAYQMSKDTGISESLISNWKSGRQLPKYDSLNTLADYFGVSGDYLLGRSNYPETNTKILEKSLKTHEELNYSTAKTIIIPFYSVPASAGTGTWLSDDIPVEYINVPNTDKTSKADFMIEVKGDSMEPKFFDGDRVLIKSSQRIYEGEIGVFILNNEAYIKKMGRKELISLNSAYDPIKLYEYDDIYCAGKVLGTLDLQ